MNRNLAAHRSLVSLCELICLALALAASPLFAEPIRIASWNLQSLTGTTDTNATEEARLNSAAYALRRIKPDVLLLQEVPDWKTASAIARRIDPKFGVRICSAYTTAEGQPRSARQMAILSRFPGAVTWHESWMAGTNGQNLGYALALLDLGTRRVGFASLALPESTNATPSAARLLAAGQFFTKLAEVRGWKTNGPTAFIFGGTLGAGDEVTDTVMQRARDEGFTSAFLNLPRESRATRRGRDGRPAATTDYIYGEGGGYVAPVQLSPNIVSDHTILAVDWDPDRAMPVIMVSDLALANSGNAPGPAADKEIASATPPQLATNVLFGIDLKWWVLGLGGTVLLLVMVVLRRPAPRPFDPSHALSSSKGDKILFLADTEAAQRTGGVEPLLAESERRRLRPHLLKWLKEAFIGGLLRQRGEMITTQDAATRQAAELGRRVERLQGQLFERITSAENRVVELERELAVAKSENRELIQANLLLAQRELAEARAKVASQGGR